MLDQEKYDAYIEILHRELIPALGCTEPIAVALAAAKARELLDREPDDIYVCCSGNVIKNVKGVQVPNAEGRKGIPIAAAMGIAIGDTSGSLEVLDSIDDKQFEKAIRIVEDGRISCGIAEGVDNLYIDVTLRSGIHESRAIIEEHHTEFVYLKADDEVLLDKRKKDDHCGLDDLKDLLNISDIIDFADALRPADVADVFDQMIEMNTRISDYGLENACGCQVGRTLLAKGKADTGTRAAARAASGSDARMNGCTLPVMINSGSGNQGLTVSLPVLTYAEDMGKSREDVYRALAVSNLVAMHQKKFIGTLSAFCGAVCAACGAGAAISYLHGGSTEQIADTITNTIGNIGGIICDGAKSSCAAKIASAVNAAVLGFEMQRSGNTFCGGDGIIQNDIEKTMECVGYIGREGMGTTDIEILKVMTDQVRFG